MIRSFMDFQAQMWTVLGSLQGVALRKPQHTFTSTAEQHIVKESDVSRSSQQSCSKTKQTDLIKKKSVKTSTSGFCSAWEHKTLLNVHNLLFLFLTLRNKPLREM